ncbi:type II toxin-antitoxin system RelE/ParE family toxin [Methylobacterium sp. NEAU 140]|uniref:type II toxin-antitoxin system RelE/ParE family toxin n=1 Tax=Methylobacterium sp. NEAU 140 TaxID=3064945 RepID=UPI0027368923|nr:type II toxin-antitoxin system RelE/ParE family toxin [Methylobacterium sp. NEAU 140]MDP4026789.1 type II toxin-antitoxin system RelE/ParE family toxin [Methylobacterium sp. NEAU 140]
MDGPLLTVVETEIYLRSAERVMDAAEREAVTDYVAAHPQDGDVIPGSGGIRKIRVPLSGRGKRGGGRVLTFYVKDRAVYLLLVYAKADQENPTPEQARVLRHLVKTL